MTDEAITHRLAAWLPYVVRWKPLWTTKVQRVHRSGHLTRWRKCTSGHCRDFQL